MTYSTLARTPEREISIGESTARHLDRELFLGAMRQSASGVAIATAEGSQGRFARTVSSFTSVSADPPMILICMNGRSPLCAAIIESRSFAVNLLGVHQAETADTFAGRPRAGKPYDLSSVDWIGQGDDHEPFLAGAVASMSCALEQHYPAGSHIIFVGRTATLRWVDGPPLIYWARNYAAAAPLRRSDESRETIQQSGR